MSRKLKIALPKGSLQDSTLSLMKQAGYSIYLSDRNYRPTSNDPELEFILIRAQEIGRYIDQGFLDGGITGLDWVKENRADLVDLAELAYSKTTTLPIKWVLLVPENSPIKNPKDLEGKRIATEGVEITKQYLANHGVNAHVEFSWGATEVKIPELVDAIVDVTETGSSIVANHLRVVDTLLTSYPHFYANSQSYQDTWKKEKLDEITLLLNGALAARGRVGLKMNVPQDTIEQVIAILPSLKNPTQSPLVHSNWVALETIIQEDQIIGLLPKLKSLGVVDMIEFPLNKVIY